MDKSRGTIGKGKEDAAYFFVRDIFTYIDKNWSRIKRWLEKPWPIYNMSGQDKGNMNRTLIPDETRGCCEFALAVVAMEISCIPADIMNDRGREILSGISDALKTIKTGEILPDPMERVLIYLDFMDFPTGEKILSERTCEDMLYYLYRNMGLKNKNGWADLFLSSRLGELVRRCTKESWTVFLEQ